jgi:hypothetical protein
MRKRKIIVFGTATIIVLADIIYRIITGKDVGFFEIAALGIFMMMFLSAITWGNKVKKNGILQEEELGIKIKEQSSKISYFILLFIILLAVFTDKIVNGTINIFLLIVLGLTIVILPFVEYLDAKKYK